MLVNIEIGVLEGEIYVRPIFFPFISIMHQQLPFQFIQLVILNPITILYFLMHFITPVAMGIRAALSQFGATLEGAG